MLVGVVEEAKLAVPRSTYWYPRFRTTFGCNIYSIPPPATQPALIDDVCELSDRPPVLKLLFKSTLLGYSAGAVKEYFTGSPTGTATNRSVPINVSACVSSIIHTRSGQSAAHRTFETRPGQICFKSVDPRTLLPVVASLSTSNPTASYRRILVTSGVRRQRFEHLA